jgi:hypothetical protein
MNHHRRLLSILAALTLMTAFQAGSAAAATPIAAFVNPAPGIISVVQTGTFDANWTIAAGAGVTATTIVTQTSRPIGVTGCDVRWLPVTSAVVAGTSYRAIGLASNRCYRFLLLLSTGSGPQTITSSAVIPAPAGLGPTADFTNPFTDGLVVYETTAHVGWAQRDTFGAAITTRSLVEQSAAEVAGGCAGVTWSSPVAVAFTGSTVNRTQARSHCYRYILTLSDSAGFRSVLTSGAMLVAGALPAWTGTMDLYRPGAFASQATTTWCVAASSQMELNIALGRSDTSSTSQATYMTYAQANDGGNYPAGSNPAGWAAALNRYGGASYTVARYTDSTTALKNAAIRMRLSNKPVGMLVWSGRHAWTMTGFTATADPALTANFTITAVFVSGPLYPRAANSSGYDLAPDTSLTPAQLGKYFLKYTDTIVRTWNGGWVLIVP